MAVEIRSITADEHVAYRRAVRFGFLTNDTTDDIDWAAGMTPDPTRARAAFDDGRIVATLKSFATSQTVPGGEPVPVGGLTAVTCQATHRRRGLLSGMIGLDLADSKERGELADILIAAEYPIYGRFGYGPAVLATTWELDLTATRFTRPAPGTVEFADNETFRKEAPAVFERVRRQRPGMIERDDFDWDFYADLRRPPEEKPWTGFRVLCRDDDGAVQGWANYTVEEKWEGMRPGGTVQVKDLCAATPGAEARLWQYLAQIDLVRSLKAGDRPVDEQLPWLLQDARAAKCANRLDFVWVRPLDVPRLLEARAYEATGRVVLEVVDDQGLAGGRFVLDASPAGATCAPTDEAADVTLPVRTLGAVVLGGPRLAGLHAAGWSDEHRDGAIAIADRLFAGSVTPWCNTWF